MTVESLPKVKGQSIWNLDRVDQRSQKLDQKYAYLVNGSGSTISILDTGVQASFADFSSAATGGQSRVVAGINLLDPSTTSSNVTDGNGHGEARTSAGRCCSFRARSDLTTTPPHQERTWRAPLPG